MGKMASAQSGSAQQQLEWLAGQPDLEALRSAYPRLWSLVQSEIRSVSANGDLEELRRQSELAARPVVSTRRQRRGPESEALVLAEARRQMKVAALRRLCLAAAAGVPAGTRRLRFGRLDGWVLQRLLFEAGLRRKPVSLRRFRITWPLVRERRKLMPLVVGQGIYCFYTKALVAELAKVIGQGTCLEIAAGDGTLTRFLRDRGADVVATDDYSWSRTVSFPAEVERLDAVSALETYAPETVICSWPPADNDFERQVFSTASVRRYIVIGSAHDFASGSAAAYEEQELFDRRDAPELARLVLPPEIEPAVKIFERRQR